MLRKRRGGGVAVCRFTYIVRKGDMKKKGRQSCVWLRAFQTDRHAKASLANSWFVGRSERSPLCGTA